MYDAVNTVERDSGGNYWYMTMNGSCSPLSRHASFRTDIDMTDAGQKALALSVCRPFAMVCTRCGQMLQNGRYYVTDAKGNEKRSYKDIVSLLQNPNPLQTGRAFLKDVEIMLKCFGYCPIYMVRTLPSSLPRAMFIVRPELFHMEGTGNLYGNYAREELVKRAYALWRGRELEFESYEYFVVADSTIVYGENDGDEMRFRSVTDTLTHDVRNYMAQAIARGNLIINGGPKAIIYGNDTTDAGNAALTKSESDAMNAEFKRKYGLVNKPYEIMVTNKKVGVAQIGSTAAQLGLSGEEEMCLSGIANALGLNPCLFFKDSTYSNQEEAKIAAYQDLIMPDADNIAEALTRALCPEGVFIRLDYSGVSCLQKHRKSLSESLTKAAGAVSSLLSGGVITVEEARTELANYLDINPDDMPEKGMKNEE